MPSFVDWSCQWAGSGVKKPEKLNGPGLTAHSLGRPRNPATPPSAPLRTGERAPSRSPANTGRPAHCPPVHLLASVRILSTLDPISLGSGPLPRPAPQRQAAPTRAGRRRLRRRLSDDISTLFFS